MVQYVVGCRQTEDEPMVYIDRHGTIHGSAFSQGVARFPTRGEAQHLADEFNEANGQVVAIEEDRQAVIF